ncbi:MAG: hypothetical protein ACXVC1_04295 [Tumebacillaceae bacterium]
MEHRRSQSYEERFLAAYKRFEKPLLRLIMGGFMLMLVVQLVLSFPAGRQLLSPTDRLEGARTGSVTTTAGQDQSTALIITAVEDGLMPQVWVKVDNVPVANFAQSTVTIKVKDGDTVTIDSTALPGVHRFQIDLNSPNVGNPVAGTVVEANNSQVATIGPVEFIK